METGATGKKGGKGEKEKDNNNAKQTPGSTGEGSDEYPIGDLSSIDTFTNEQKQKFRNRVNAINKDKTLRSVYTQAHVPEEAEFKDDEFAAFDPMSFNLGASWIMAVASLFAYQGYNPATFLAFLKSYCKMVGIGIEEFKADMQMLLIFFVSRGTKIYHKKIQTRTKKAGIDILKALMVKYNIYKGPNPKSSNDVTIGRIAGVFPIQVADLMSDPAVSRVVGEQPKDLPRNLCFSGAPALIPKGYGKLMTLWMEWANSFDEVVNGEGADPEKVFKFAKITWDSDWVDNNTRTKMVKGMGWDESKYKGAVNEDIADIIAARAATK